jgi:oligopeptide/dipeptide ABC transporter ATP-binding protein
MTAEAVLSLQNVSMQYPLKSGPFGRVIGHKPVLDDVSIDLREGEVLGLLGESGSGKSTLGRVMLGLLKPSAGAVRFRNQELAGMPRKVRSAFRRKAQLIFQDPLSALNPTMSIEDIVTEPLRIQRRLQKSSKRSAAQSLLSNVSLDPNLMARRPSELSGGQRQRVVIARALSVDPDFVVADEPVSALDVSIQAQILELLSNLRRSMRLTMLFISHDITVVRYVADRIAVMYHGKIVEIAPAATLISSPIHPYTQMLLASAPDLDGQWDTEHTPEIHASQEVSRSTNGAGCVFAHRCPYAEARCRTTTPTLRMVAPDHSHACLLRN